MRRRHLGALQWLAAAIATRDVIAHITVMLNLNRSKDSCLLLCISMGTVSSSLDRGCLRSKPPVGGQGLLSHTAPCICLQHKLTWMCYT